MAETIGKYTVQKELGRGGFGKVYLAFDPDVGQPVAIKKLLAQGDPDLLKRFQLEIRTTAGLRHKNIVTIHASGEDKGDPYLVMEFLEGQTLKQALDNRRPFSLMDKVRIMTQVAEGLAYAHSKGVVHRDVKPENIMLLADDTVKIMDFGIALGPNRNTAVTQVGGIIGTPPYFAPEQLQGFKASEQTDIFSFGDVYYELLTGFHPFEHAKTDWNALHDAILTYEPRSVGELVPGCPAALEDLVHRALAKEPEFRIQKFQDIVLESEAILVDLKHEGAAAILREVPRLTAQGDFSTALSKINYAFQLDPGNREVRRLREEINLRIRKEQVQSQISKALADAERYTKDRRWAEAVDCLETGARLDTTNAIVAARLEEAKARLDHYVRTNRLVSEARHLQQKGNPEEADRRLQEALTLDPDHTEAKRLRQRVRDELEKRRQEQQRQQAISAAQDLRAAKRFADALAALAAFEKEFPKASGIAELRAAIQREQSEETRRLRAERFSLALARTREAIQAGDLEHARPMIEHLDANFATEPGAANVLRELHQHLDALARAREIAQYQQQARALLNEKAFREALKLLAEARRRFPDDTGLQRLYKTADEDYKAHQRSEAIAAALKEAAARRDSGDLPGALNTIQKARRDLGDYAALLDLERQLQNQIEQQRYNAGLERVLRESRELMAAGSYPAAIDRLQGAAEFGGEAEVRALLSSALAAEAAAEERRTVMQVQSEVARHEAAGALDQALSAAEQGLSRYPHNSAMTQVADELRARVKVEQRRAAMEQARARISREIHDNEWKRAEESVRQARAEFPGEAAFEDLARELEAASYEDGWRQLAGRVDQNLESSALPQAQDSLKDQRTIAIYGRDPRWSGLVDKVAQRQSYEEALLEASRQWNLGRLTQAEGLLTKIIDQGAPDKRAQQMRRAIQVQRSEAQRQQEIARIAEGVRERLNQGDVPRAESELAAGRARYPGESTWTGVQAELETRQLEVRRQADVTEAAQSVRHLVERDDLPGAATALLAARTKYPQETLWSPLETEIRSRQEVLNQRTTIETAAENIRRWLQRDHAGDLKAGSMAARRDDLLRLRRDDLQPAKAELEAARANHPGEALWDQLQTEIEARGAFLEAETAMGGRISQLVENGDLAAAQSQLAAARAAQPDESFWGIFQAEIKRCGDLRRSHADIARIAQSIRQRLQRDDLRSARVELDSARIVYPQEDSWAALQQEIDARQAEFDRQAGIAASAKDIRERLDRGIRDVLSASTDAPFGTYPIVRVWDVLRNASARLDQARSRFPDEAIWETLSTEITERQIQLECEIAETVRAGSNLAQLEWHARQLASARLRYPNEPFWPVLQAEIDVRRAPLEQVSVAEFAARVRESVRQGDLQTALIRLDAARKKHPAAPAWDLVQSEIDEHRSQLTRDQDLAAVERILREQLEQVALIDTQAEHPSPIETQGQIFQQASAMLGEAWAQYPGERRLQELQSELEARRTQWADAISRGITGAAEGTAGDPGGILRWFGPQIFRLREQYPNDPVFGRLGADIDDLQARVGSQTGVFGATKLGRLKDWFRRGR